MPRKKRQRIQLIEEPGTVVLDMGPIEIWDGADLALLRETVTRLVQTEHRRSLSFAMHHVKYVPSGFFGMLLDCYDRGVEILLLDPNEKVTGMLWFQQFFASENNYAYALHAGPVEDVPHDSPLPWTSDSDQEIWDANLAKRSAMPSYQKH
ncbi:MAG: hypothetical protein ACE37I_04305 [Rubinisphaera brasiliensis]|uniref:STAS domain-containing protein n=1 Tax=Rubinisphaera brasiliensis (strain ATCC 49424 / DSM 5305 / JCM 21570 / IAM 15109 / NBRC 103401 / IFAM 1448) TaxID=756272 RepID=F0SJE6_RUBBR|nr:hypothetical protein [Rubinisphaera brasiliensis]ADY59721.1 hypothetical protein Plabr_2118 [Rubinisphaera brasiliensis DSM 5305]MBB01615.1 hypothetical protein [Planctomyces sp.]MBR9804177.1 hypothetical protein [bacterium]